MIKPWYFASIGKDSLQIYDEEVFKYRGGSISDCDIRRFASNVPLMRDGARKLREVCSWAETRGCLGTESARRA